MKLASYLRAFIFGMQCAGLTCSCVGRSPWGGSGRVFPFFYISYQGFSSRQCVSQSALDFLASVLMISKGVGG
jgi:hypothetical protein